MQRRVRAITQGLLTLGLALAGCRRTTPGTSGASAAASPDTLLDRQGALSETDPRTVHGLQDQYELPVNAGQRLLITLSSAAFDPVLEVRTPDGAQLTNDDYRGDRTRSQLALEVRTAGTLKVRVHGYALTSQGPYRLQVERSAMALAAPTVAMAARGNSAQNSPEVAGLQVSPGATNRSHHVLPPVLPPGAPLAVDQQRVGALGASSMQLVTGEQADVYQFQGQAGSSVNLELQSTDMDTFLLVVGPGGQQWINDDAGGTTNSALTLPLPVDGNYTVLATSYRPGQTGAYRLKLSQAHRSSLAALMPESVGVGLAMTPPAMPGVSSLAPQAQSGALAAGDTTLTTGEFFDTYRFNLTLGQPVRVRALSTEFDTYLIVRTPSGPQRDNDDVSPQDRNAGLDYTPTETGAHQVLVTSYRPGETGHYQLTLEPLAPGSPPLTTAVGATPLPANNGAAVPVAPTPAGVGEIAPSAPTLQQGELAQGDRQLRTGEFMDQYTFQWPAGARVRLEARSDRFDTYLLVHSPSGRQQDNDDGIPGTTNAALDLLTSEAGTWTVAVTSYRPGETGPYQLSVNAGGAGVAAAGAAPSPQPEPGSVAVVPDGGNAVPTPAFEPLVGPGPSNGTSAPQNGARVHEGSLAQGDRQLRTGEFTESHTMQFRPGESVRFRLESTAFDAYLIVRPPSGRQLDNDDLVPGSTNAGIDIPVAEAGDYTVMVTTYRPGETGNYTLRVEHGAAGSLPAAQSAAVLQGGPAAAQLVAAAQATANGGRVFGVFAGVTDYPAGVNDLTECANDARKIDQALSRRGLITPEQRVVLTDSQATVANVRAAMQQMATRVGPNDVFMFFWSGHGGRVENVRSTDTREIDGIDEYIYLYDGRMLDDEMGTLFDGINARVSVLALDSCFAGGFAKDVITRPGRVGLFSSEEDVTSAVAQQFQAGGYLSHFLQTGIEGEGDADPHDGVLTVGELTFYLYSHFGAHASDMRMSDGHQQLVIDRGAVSGAVPLFQYPR